MSADHARVRALFHEVFDLEERERAVLLERAEPNLRAAVVQLLDEASKDELDEQLAEDVRLRLIEAAAAEVHAIPEQIEGYRIERKLGEGGMGVVYAARTPDSDREVALKVLRPGVSSPTLLRRFRREIRVLERLRDPGIARFHGEGEMRVESPAGAETMPFLVMELVRGKSLLDHARHRGLDLDDRIELLARVCDAIGHAHENGVVHRDLKPTNLLVVEEEGDRVGRPKVLDFGVAKAVDLDAKTMSRTSTGTLIGTLPYMSPEQVDGRSSSVGARSDVYSLGVIAFELLAERLPYLVRELPMLEAARVIREQEPTKLGSVSTRCRGPLEVIVSKALEKDPEMRYASAVEFGRDLRAYLVDAPIAARSPGWRSRAHRFARRNKVLVISSTSAFVALTVGLVFAIGFALEAGQARSDAVLSATQALGAATRGHLAAAVGALDQGAVAVPSGWCTPARDAWAQIPGYRNRVLSGWEMVLVDRPRGPLPALAPR